jgi:hypothetical protein
MADEKVMTRDMAEAVAIIEQAQAKILESWRIQQSFQHDEQKRFLKQILDEMLELKSLIRHGQQ